ncbi:hypothetical protein [Ekhidna sp.]|uniref:hypothetical protein n=1 Tax=Ekhidna sp. TaxID=2608089 RepID=UPI003CCBCAA6
MKPSHLFILFIALLSTSCGKEYETVQANIVDIQIEKGEDDKYFVAAFEYNVEDQIYQDTFKLGIMATIQDTLLTPMQGVKFDIQYNVDDPADIVVDYRVKQ